MHLRDEILSPGRKHIKCILALILEDPRFESPLSAPKLLIYWLFPEDSTTAA